MPPYSSPSSSITSYDIVFDTNELQAFTDFSVDIGDALSQVRRVLSIVNRFVGIPGLSELSQVASIVSQVSRVGQTGLSERIGALLGGRIGQTLLGRELGGIVSDVRRAERRITSIGNLVSLGLQAFAPANIGATLAAIRAFEGPVHEALESLGLDHVSEVLRTVTDVLAAYQSVVSDLQRIVRTIRQTVAAVQSGSVPYTGAELDGFASGLTVHFKQGSYTYTSASVGDETIDTMIELAENNSGLQGFINRTLR